MTSTPSLAACGTAFETDSALILGGKSQKIGTIARALEPHFGEVSVANGLPSTDHRKNFGLIVVTDDIDPAPDRGFVNQLREHYPRAKVLGIFDSFDAEIEIVMRSAGIVFWGSHERFNTHSEKILQTVLQNKVTAAAE
jgi:hypothetical protein